MKDMSRLKGGTGSSLVIIQTFMADDLGILASANANPWERAAENVRKLCERL